MFLRGLEGWHLVIIVGLLAVLFGSRKLPDAARSIGQSLRIFKSEMKAAHDDEPATPIPTSAPAARTDHPAPQVIQPAPDFTSTTQTTAPHEHTPA